MSIPGSQINLPTAPETPYYHHPHLLQMLTRRESEAPDDATALQLQITVTGGSSQGNMEPPSAGRAQSILSHAEEKSVNFPGPDQLTEVADGEYC